MKRALIPLLILLAPAGGCSTFSDPAGPVEIRILNASTMDFDRVLVGFPDEQEDYGAVAAGARTGYREIGRAYRYAYVEVQVGGETLVLQPIDYVGESLLEPGRYTYALDVEPSSSGLTLALRPGQ